MNFQYYKRGFRKIKNKFKKIIRTRRGRKVIKISLLTYDITRVVYNPFYIFDIVKRITLKNLLT
tara:strand:- start:421 stop:612 length:192 start_codon:yes stop_codon:yes gene_type:complete